MSRDPGSLCHCMFTKQFSRWPRIGDARTWPYREIRNDIERLWHDAAIRKARVFLGLERKLLDLSFVILAYFLVILRYCFPFLLRTAAIYTI